MARKNPFRRLLEFVERFPFSHGPFTYVRFRNEHPDVKNRGEAGAVPDERIPEDIVEESRRRLYRRDDGD